MTRPKIPTLFKAALALVMLAAGLATLAGFDRMGLRFAALGAPVWMRALAGLVQIGAAVGLMAPGRTGYGAALALLASAAAIMAHAAVLGWDSAPPAVALAVAAAVLLWRSRADFQH